MKECPVCYHPNPDGSTFFEKCGGKIPENASTVAAPPAPAAAYERRPVQQPVSNSGPSVAQYIYAFLFAPVGWAMGSAYIANGEERKGMKLIHVSLIPIWIAAIILGIALLGDM